MRNLKVMGRALLDVYDSMFPLLTINIVWALLASIPVSYLLALSQASSDSPEAATGIPVLTFILGLVLVLLTGPASYALAVLMRRVAEYESISVRDFFLVIRQHYRRGWLMGLVSLLGTTLIVINLNFYATLGGWAVVLLPLFLLLTLIWLLVLLYLYPMAVITEGGPRRIVRNCLIVIIRHPGLSLMAGLMALIMIVLSSALIVPWVILTMGAITAIGTRALRSAIRRDNGQPEEDPIADEPLPPILTDETGRPTLPHYGWRSARREADDQPQ